MALSFLKIQGPSQYNTELNHLKHKPETIKTCGVRLPLEKSQKRKGKSEITREKGLTKSTSSQSMS